MVCQSSKNIILNIFEVLLGPLNEESKPYNEHQTCEVKKILITHLNTATVTLIKYQCDSTNLPITFARSKFC